MKRVDFWNGILFIVISVVLIVASIQLSFGEFRKPGPGFLPLLLSILLGILSIVLAVKTIFEKKNPFTTQKLLAEQIRWIPIVIVLILMVSWGILLELIGYPMVTFFFLILMIRFAEPQTWKTSLLWATIGSVGTHLMFNIWMKLRLPKGDITQTVLRLLTGGQ